MGNSATKATKVATVPRGVQKRPPISFEDIQRVTQKDEAFVNQLNQVSSAVQVGSFQMQEQAEKNMPVGYRNMLKRAKSVGEISPQEPGYLSAAQIKELLTTPRSANFTAAMLGDRFALSQGDTEAILAHYRWPKTQTSGDSIRAYWTAQDMQGTFTHKKLSS
eukprot:GILJ01003434.1.p1 GENE.GILJ01003434.1~~GILJ01003434.1.p1  ORF type:complete len:163 (-),score=14.29 GILJ01003434.1:172-660(-)